MNISKSRLIQIIKEEIDIFEAEKKALHAGASKYDKDHPGKSCDEAHGGLTHEEYSVDRKPMLTREEQKMLNEMDW